MHKLLNNRLRWGNLGCINASNQRRKASNIRKISEKWDLWVIRINDPPVTGGAWLAIANWRSKQ